MTKARFASVVVLAVSLASFLAKAKIGYGFHEGF